MKFFTSKNKNLFNKDHIDFENYMKESSYDLIETHNIKEIFNIYTEGRIFAPTFKNRKQIKHITERYFFCIDIDGLKNEDDFKYVHSLLKELDFNFYAPSISHDPENSDYRFHYFWFFNENILENNKNLFSPYLDLLADHINNKFDLNNKNQKVFDTSVYKDISKMIYGPKKNACGDQNLNKKSLTLKKNF